MWRPDPSSLSRVRERIAERPAEWQRARDSRPFNAAFVLGGESLKRPPKGFGPDAPHLEDLKRKDFIASATLDAAEIGRPEFLDTVAGLYGLATPFMRFLCRAIEVEF